jgi:hypothetical protein
MQISECATEVKTMAVTRTHFTFRVDTWTADGESIVEHVAGVEVARPQFPQAKVPLKIAQKPIAATKKWLCEQPNNHSAAALHLVPRGRPQASIALSA